MTTVTEAAKRIGEWNSPCDSENLDLASICQDPLLAQRIAQEIALAAVNVIPDESWSLEDIRDIFDAALRRDRRPKARIVEGRYFRKRVREHCGLADRYGDTFALVILAVRPSDEREAHDETLRCMVERLRLTDMAFLYRRRLALLLPRLDQESLSPLIARVCQLIERGSGPGSIEKISTLIYPEPKFVDTQAVLDWAEDQLRLTP